MDLFTNTQVELETIFSKYQLIPTIKREFVEAGMVDELVEKGVDPSFGIDLLIQMSLHKRASVPTLVGLLVKHFDDAENPAQACADALLNAAEKDFVHWFSEPKPEFVTCYEISDDVQDMLDAFQYPLPMIQPPEHVSHNRQTGYVTIKGSLILKDNHHDEDICLDHINRVNSIPLSLNADVVAFVENSWRNLDKPKPDEDMADFKKRLAAFNRYDDVSHQVVEALALQGENFWLTHKYDKRGRTYCQGYHVNYQGNSWNKAVVGLGEAEPLNME